MSALQEQAVQMVFRLSDDNLSFLIEVICRLLSKPSTIPQNADDVNKGIEAFHHLNEARSEIKRYFSDDFDPDKELEAVRIERSGSQQEVIKTIKLS